MGPHQLDDCVVPAGFGPVPSPLPLNPGKSGGGAADEPNRSGSLHYGNPLLGALIGGYVPELVNGIGFTIPLFPSHDVGLKRHSGGKIARGGDLVSSFLLSLGLVGSHHRPGPVVSAGCCCGETHHADHADAGRETQGRYHTWSKQGRMPLLAPIPACQGRYRPPNGRDRTRGPGLAAQPLKGIPGIPGRKLRPRTATDAAPGNGADGGSCGPKQRSTDAPVSGR